MKKTPRSVEITAINHGAKIGRKVTISTQRNAPVNGSQYGGIDATVHQYDVNSKLRMLRGLWLQSAFLARDGVLQ